MALDMAPSSPRVQATASNIMMAMMGVNMLVGAALFVLLASSPSHDHAESIDAFGRRAAAGRHYSQEMEGEVDVWLASRVRAAGTGSVGARQGGNEKLPSARGEAEDGPVALTPDYPKHPLRMPLAVIRARTDEELAATLQKDWHLLGHSVQDLTTERRRDLVDRLHNSPWTFPDLTPTPLLTAEVLDLPRRGALILAIHRQQHQSLARLRNTTNAKLLDIADRIRKFSPGPHGGDRSKGGVKVGKGFFEAIYYVGPILQTALTATFVAMLQEVGMIYRATGVKMALAHEGLLGWHQTRRLLPWGRKLTLNIAHTDLAKLEVLSSWWENRDVDLIVRDGSNDGNGRDNARLIFKTNGVFISVVALAPSGDVRSARAAEYGVGSRPLKAGAETVQDMVPNIYNTADMFPLQETMCEGSLVFLPRAVTPVLQQEFGEGPLTATFSGSYTFDAALQSWVQDRATLLGAQPDDMRGELDIGIDEL